MKVFNVDALASEDRRIVLKGVEHPVVEMDTDSFIATLEAADQLEKDTSTRAQMDTVVKMVHRAIPTLSEQEIRKLSLDQLNAIAQFVRGDIPDALKEASAQGEEGKK